MGYTCIRPMKVQTAAGAVEMRKPGDPVPEAETWANPAIWIKRGYIQADDVETAKKSGYMRDKLIPAREATEADIKRAAAHVPMPGKPLDGVADSEGEGDAGGDDTGSDGQTVEVETDLLKELLELSRSDLDTLAGEHGIEEAEKLANKTEVAKVILAKQE